MNNRYFDLDGYLPQPEQRFYISSNRMLRNRGPWVNHSRHAAELELTKDGAGIFEVDIDVTKSVMIRIRNGIIVDTKNVAY